MSREEELKKEVEKLEAKLEAFKKELDKPKTHYPQLIEGYFLNCFGNIQFIKDDYNKNYSAKGNVFETRERAIRSNLYKLLNSEYDYWFPGFSEKPDFEPNGLQYFCRVEKKWLSTVNWTHIWKKNNYRWKRSEN